jgi:hypothetical protein
MITGCEAIASYLLYNWIQDEFGNGGNKETPVIRQILTDKQEVHINENVVLEVDAVDNKDDAGALDYFWVASAGTLTNPTSRITIWKAPDKAGKVTITIMVEDTDGNQDSQAVEIDVLE